MADWPPHRSSGGANLDDPRLSELYDLSKAAREMRSQLASSLQQAQIEHKYGSLKESMRRSRFFVRHVLTFRRQLIHDLFSPTFCQSKERYFGTTGSSGPFVSSSSSFSWLCTGMKAQSCLYNREI